MINKDTMVKIVNKFNGTVGYDVPDLNIHRNFYPKESKDVSFEELQRLSYTPGGEVVLKEYLEITDKDVIKELFSQDFEPEYHYTREDVKQLMLTGTLDQFLDCLDFAPEVIKEIIKTMAVDLPLNDMAKRQAILDKMGFDVTKAIEIKNTKYDGGDSAVETGNATSRRTAPIKSDTAQAAPTGRRYKPITNKNE